MFPTTLDKSCSVKRWKSIKLKKRYNFSNSKFYPFLPNINVESGHDLLSKALNFGSNIELGEEGFFHWKIDFLFCRNSFLQDSRLLIYFEKTIPNCLVVLKCISMPCMLYKSYKSDLGQLLLIFSIKMWYFWRLP